MGKSTLFNRLTEQRKAIVDDTSGVTRDRIYGTAEWGGRQFNVIDTGGFVARPEDVFEQAIREQVHIALDEADVILFMVDVTTGITDQDEEMADILRKQGRKVILVINKVDNFTREMEAQLFYRLGFEQTLFLSSITGSGTGELLDLVVSMLGDPEPEEPEPRKIPRLAIIGQPNVGKSSLVNALIGQERNIVTEIAGTTRDAINTHYKYFNKEFILTDTAGLRKKTKVHENLEFYSVIRAIRAMDYSDVCLLLIDATKGIEGQDLNIFRLVQRKRKGLVILVNKWDLVEKDHTTSRQMEQQIRERIAPWDDVPVLFISATGKTRIFKAVETALEVYENMQRRISTSALNQWLESAVAHFNPPAVRGQYIRIKYVTQLPVHPPVFAFFCNRPKDIKAPYIQYLENRLRESFNFTGVPLKLVFRQK